MRWGGRGGSAGRDWRMPVVIVDLVAAPTSTQQAVVLRGGREEEVGDLRGVGRLCHLRCNADIPLLGHLAEAGGEDDDHQQEGAAEK